MRSISRSEIDAVREGSKWDFGNRVLYDLCRDHPLHVKEEVISAKVWLIGRAYAAAIERRRNKDKSEPGEHFYEDHVAPKMREEDIDQWLADIPKHEPGTPQSISVHRRLTDLFKKITGLEKRSLASKYLHFHLPEAFYLYDSRAKLAITKVVPRLSQLPDIATDHYDLARIAHRVSTVFVVIDSRVREEASRTRAAKWARSAGWRLVFGSFLG